MVWYYVFARARVHQYDSYASTRCMYVQKNNSLTSRQLLSHHPILQGGYKALL